ncbi:iron uptake porin [Nostoc sp. CENA67]|uniref:Iron uptake porin n=1 Tax=Amazonocrinis nigriterrae CENA67 TaxID=2794033 RepID=A0A8J7HL16_9NOST|nr:iron uptake porin [Amazonocrinis nigriterrae]MBH8561592.1 iron uptake porin [Amazonocrinis nigriterrae CENA67]
MKKLDVPFTLTSVILSVNLLTSWPVLAQTDLDPNSPGEEYLTNAQDFQLSSQNQLTSVNSLEELPTNETLQAQSQQLDINAPSDLDEIVNVNQLEDVTPNDWAYEALRNLVEKYQCISSDGEGNFNGNRAMTRYEFAAALNNCLLKVGRSISSLDNKFTSQEDLAVFQRLQAEFSQELQSITAKIDQLEDKTALLQENQFSTTTVLRGAIVFNLVSGFGDKKAVSPGNNSTEKLDANTTVSALSALTLDTSFTGKDRLRTQFLIGNVNNYGTSVTGTEMTRLTGAVDTGNYAVLGSLFYEFPIGDRGIVAIAPAADFPTRIFPPLNPISSISNFGAESPIYSFAFGTGAIAYYQFSDTIAAGITYLSSSGSFPSQGLFNGQYTALTQVTYTPSNKIGIAFTYGHYYAPEPGATIINVTGSKGSQFAQLPFGANTATSSDAFGLQFTYKLTDKLILGGWTSYFNAHAEGSPSVSRVNGSPGADADIWSWAVTASLVDVGKLGSQFSFVFGMPPKVTNNDVTERRDQDTSLHFELSYRYPLTNRIFITPGFLMITNPEHNAANDTVWVGLVKTAFLF